MRFWLMIVTGMCCATTEAQVARVHLSNYQLTQTVPLPSVVSEASTVTYNRATNSIFIAGDAGLAVAQFTKTGVLVNQMTLSGFNDTEGLTSAAGGQFVIAEERDQDLYLFTYVAGTTLVRSTLQMVSLGANVGNSGIEGVSFDPVGGMYLAVKEKSPSRVMSVNVNFGAASASVVDLFSPALLGVTDISDIAALSSLPSLLGTPDQNNLLITSQESARLLKVSPTGAVLGTFNFTGISSTLEGVTIDDDGVIYLVDETPRLYILRPPCRGDFNGVDGATVQDIFDFLAAWFVADPAADFNARSGVSVQDIFDFLAAWFAGCA